MENPEETPTENTNEGRSQVYYDAVSKLGGPASKEEDTTLADREELLKFLNE